MSKISIRECEIISKSDNRLSEMFKIKAPLGARANFRPLCVLLEISSSDRTQIQHKRLFSCQYLLFKILSECVQQFSRQGKISSYFYHLWKPLRPIELKSQIWVKKITIISSFRIGNMFKVLIQNSDEIMKTK